MIQGEIEIESSYNHVNTRLELSKWVARPGLTWPTTGWPLSEPTQPDSLISES